MVIEYSARSHMGRVRENNEDNLFADGILLPPDAGARPFAIDGNAKFPAVFAVCDGIGGEENGEIASLLSVQMLSSMCKHFKLTAPERLGWIVGYYAGKVNDFIQFEAKRLGKQMGTTLALVVATGNQIYCFNIGDSRIYVLKKAALRQITNDHTTIAEQVRAGLINPGYATSAKQGSKLMRCIGMGDSHIVESYPPISGKCRILICSDGLSDMVNPTGIEDILNAFPRAEDAANSLLEVALENGGRDNVTLIVADVKKRA